MKNNSTIIYIYFFKHNVVLQNSNSSFTLAGAHQTAEKIESDDHHRA